MKVAPFLLTVSLAAAPVTSPQLLRELSFPASVASALSLSSFSFFQTEKPEWCKPLPRPEYKSLQRVLPDDPWFEIYKVAPGVFAMYEPHQAEETISYLIVGTKQAVLFDTGMALAIFIESPRN